MEISIAILPLHQNRRGNFHGHFAFASKLTWKFPWPFCLCIKTDVEISMAILPLYQNRRENFQGYFAFISNRRGNLHGHFAFVSKPTWKFPRIFCIRIKTDEEISMDILPLYQKLAWKFPWLFSLCITN